MSCLEEVVVVTGDVVACTSVCSDGRSRDWVEG